MSIARTLFSVLMLIPAAGIAADAIHVGYVTGVDPAKAAIVDSGFDRPGLHFEWRRFDNGAEAVRALAAGDVDIANIGSSVVAVAASRQLPLETVLIGSQLGTSEALVARNGSGIKTPADLVGKTVAVPFVTTAHYSLLAALKHWGIDKNRVRIINLRISEIPAAWAGGNIDAAYAFDPALGRIKETGTVLTSSIEVAQWGAPTYDVWIARTPFSAANPAALRSFVGTALGLMEAYRQSPAPFAADPAKIDRLVRATGAKASDIAPLLAGNLYPNAIEQRSLLGGGFSKSLADTAAFLKEQGKVDTVLPSYQTYATTRFLPDAPSR